MRALLLGGAAVVLLMLVAVAAGGYSLGGSGSTEASPYAIDTLATVALAVYAIGAVAVIIGLFVTGLDVRRGGEQLRPRRRSTVIVTIILGLALLFAAASGRFHFRLHQPGSDQPTSLGSNGKQQNGSPARKSHEPRFQPVPFALVVGGVGAAVVAFVLAERRRTRRLPVEAAVADELVGALEVTLDDLRAERDPRRAVIAAYARMERALAAHGIPRRRYEAPHEYLARVLDDLTHGGRGARKLTELFEQARFSTHEIDPSLKDEAIAAVESLQAELAAEQLERAA
jgi:multisubunit Na+/H+ antiporter MnhB subunit